MPHRTEDFMRNNICAIHDEIRRILVYIRENFTHDEEVEDRINHLLQLSDLAKEKGIKMENRLKLYRFTIGGLGFERDKGLEELAFRGDNLIVERREGKENGQTSPK